MIVYLRRHRVYTVIIRRQRVHVHPQYRLISHHRHRHHRNDYELRLSLSFYFVNISQTKWLHTFLLCIMQYYRIA